MRSVLLAISIGVALSGCSTLTPTEDPVYLRITDLEARLMRIERVVNNESLIELSGQIQQLQSDTQMLRGEVETLRFETENSAERQRELYLDIDQRLQSLEQSQPRVGFSSPSTGGPNAGFGSARPGAGAGAGGFGDDPAGNSSFQPQPQVAGTDQENYQAAFDLIQARRYADAGAAFANFLAAFPQSPLADNAQYWLAETMYVQRQFGEALPAFQKVIDMYPQSAKIADALLKVGYCNFEMQQWDQARAALEQVTREFPDTTAARLASQRLERLAQEAG